MDPVGSTERIANPLHTSNIDSEPNVCGDRDAYAVPHAHRFGHTHADKHGNQLGNGHPVAHAEPVAHANTIGNRNTDGCAFSDKFRNCNAHRFEHALPDTHADAQPFGDR
jgi:hypothetical protein